MCFLREWIIVFFPHIPIENREMTAKATKSNQVNALRVLLNTTENPPPECSLFYATLKCCMTGHNIKGLVFFVLFILNFNIKKKCEINISSKVSFHKQNLMSALICNI